PIRSYFGHFRALKVTPDRVRAYIAGRQEKGRSNAKINRETELLGRAFRLAVEEGRLVYAPKIPALPERNARTGFFERAEFDEIVEHLPDHLQDFVRFAYLTGWRRSEIAGLRRSRRTTSLRGLSGCPPRDRKTLLSDRRSG